MASIFTRPRSPFYHLKFRDPISGKIKRQSSGIRIDSDDGLQQANLRCAELGVRELSRPRVASGERWREWANEYFDERYPNTHTTTRTNAKRGLADILKFMDAFDVYTPRMLTYDIARQFIPWRKSGKVLPKISQNTAKVRFVFLKVLMDEAVRRGYCTGNPCHSVKPKFSAFKEKKEITREDQEKIECMLKTAEPWMAEQWLVLMRQCCRIAETHIPMERIDTDRMTVVLKLKGTRHNPDRLHTQQLHPDLLPLIQKARDEGRTHLIPFRKNAASNWRNWFIRNKLPYTPHCCRVTTITRLLRAGHSPALVCNFVGHSEIVNVIYRRLNPPDAAALLATLSA